MTIRGNPVAAVGLALYVGSFALTAVADSTSSFLGYQCAWLSLVLPWTADTGDPVRLGPWFHTELGIAGFINPVFLVAVAAGAARQRHPRTWVFLRLLVCVMIPVCWLFFSSFRQHPLEGHFVWIAGMLLVLFGRELTAAFFGRQTFSSASDDARH